MGLRMSDWKPASLGELITLQRGFDITKATQGKGSYPVVSSGGISSYHDQFMVMGPGVVIGRKGTLGTTFFVAENYWPHDTTLWVKDFKGNDERFVYYLLKILRLERLDSGSANPTLNRNYAHLLRVAAPKKDVQQKIAVVLTTLEAKIDLNNRINAELEALAKTVYDYWFVQFEFPDSNGRPYRSSGGAMVWNEALRREVPEGWEVGSLDSLGRIVGGSTPSTTNPDHFGNGVPWITPKDLSNNKGNKFIARGETDVTEQGMKSASLSVYPAGTVLMSSRAPVGYLAIALNPVTTNQGFKSFVPSKGYATAFVYYAVERSLPAIIQYASGSTFVEISGGVLKSVQSVLPDKKVANAFCQVIEPIVDRQRTAELENRELTRLRDWLLPLLMNGQVRVT